MAAINALSTYNLNNSRLDRSHHRDLCHVACAVYVRMARYYDTHRKTGIVASLFGRRRPCPTPCLPRPYSLRPSATRTANTAWIPIHIYRCQNGFLGMHAYPWQ